MEEQGQNDEQGVAPPPLPFKTAKEILDCDDAQRAVMDVPEWGTRLRLKGVSAVELDRYQSDLVQLKRNGTKIVKDNIRAGLAARCIVDEHDRRVFNEEQVKALGRKSSKAIQRVYDKCQDLCALTDAEIEAIAGN